MIARVNKCIVNNNNIPFFEIANREIISILIENPDFESQFVNYLTGNENNNNFIILEPIVFAEYLSYTRNIINLFTGENNVLNYIRKQLFCSIEDAKCICVKLDIKNSSLIQELSYASRKLLSITIAFEKSKHIIYTIHGIGCTDIEKIRGLVEEKINTKDGTAIEINIPYVNGEKPLQNKYKQVEIKAVWSSIPRRIDKK